MDEDDPLILQGSINNCWCLNDPFDFLSKKTSSWQGKRRYEGVLEVCSCNAHVLVLVHYKSSKYTKVFFLLFGLYGDKKLQCMIYDVRKILVLIYNDHRV